VGFFGNIGPAQMEMLERTVSARTRYAFKTPGLTPASDNCMVFRVSEILVEFRNDEACSEIRGVVVLPVTM